MKNILIILAVVLVLTSAADAQPPKGYMALYSDTLRTSYCPPSAGLPYFITMYIIVLPSGNGLQGAEFAIDFPDDPGLIPTLLTPHPDIVLTNGSLADGMTASYGNCHTDWTWIFSQAFFVNTAAQLSLTPVKKTGPNAGIMVSTCGFPYPLEEVYSYNSFYINYTDGVDPECSTLGTESKTWGAIKRMEY